MNKIELFFTIVLATACFVAGVWLATQTNRQQAINANVGYYSANPTNGDTTNQAHRLPPTATVERKGNLETEEKD